MKTKTKKHFLKLMLQHTVLCFDLTNSQEVINDCLLKEKTDNVYYQHMSVATQHSYTPLKALNKTAKNNNNNNQTSFAEERSCAGNMPDLRESQRSLVKVFSLSLGLRSGSHLSE